MNTNISRATLTGYLPVLLLVNANSDSANHIAGFQCTGGIAEVQTEHRKRDGIDFKPIVGARWEGLNISEAVDLPYWTQLSKNKRKKPISLKEQAINESLELTEPLQRGSGWSNWSYTWKESSWSIFLKCLWYFSLISATGSLFTHLYCIQNLCPHSITPGL